jgi:hypothetical protein
MKCVRHLHALFRELRAASLFQEIQLTSSRGFSSRKTFRPEQASWLEGANMPNEPIPAARLRQLRDQVIRYVYEHGAGKWGWGVPIDQVERALGITGTELRTVSMLLREQGLLPNHGSLTNIGLNQEGQEEAARLGSLPMHEPSQPATIIHANYSIVQVAGAHSSQTANLSIDQSQITTLLDQIERELPQLELETGKRDEAIGILGALREALLHKLPAAGVRVLAAGLSGIITEAGSELGKRLLEALGMGAG